MSHIFYHGRLLRVTHAQLGVPPIRPRVGAPDTSSVMLLGPMLQLSFADISGLSVLFIPEPNQPNTASLTVEKAHENPTPSSEDDDLEDVVNSVLPTPDWSSGFGFSTS
jgi:hypothetical protein